jgi:hypothetical protein
LASRLGCESTRWDTASSAVVNAMLRAGVFLTAHGHPISVGIEAWATYVARVVDRYRDVTEAFRDHLALAHVLFRQFDRGVPIEDLEDRVVILLARLADRVELREETYVTRCA